MYSLNFKLDLNCMTPVWIKMENVNQIFIITIIRIKKNNRN